MNKAIRSIHSEGDKTMEDGMRWKIRGKYYLKTPEGSDQIEKQHGCSWEQAVVAGLAIYPNQEINQTT